jgi:rod shape-determining protein MreC
MPKRRKKKNSFFLTAALPFRSFFQKVVFIFVLTIAIAGLVLGKSNHEQMVAVRALIMDAALPLVRIVSMPVNAVISIGGTLHDAVFVFEENRLLRQQNARLARMQMVAAQVQTENVRLRHMLHFISEPTYGFITARVVSDISSPYMRATMINAGNAEGVKKGQVVLNEKGLVGRVLEVGEHSSRVLLLSDMNSRVPVMTSNSRERGILTGDNRDNPIMRHLRIDHQVQVGESVLTSGDGQYFPAGLPVGTIKDVDDDGARTAVFVRPEQLDYVNIIDFSADAEKAAEAAPPTAPAPQ